MNANAFLFAVVNLNKGSPKVPKKFKQILQKKKRTLFSERLVDIRV